MQEKSAEKEPSEGDEPDRSKSRGFELRRKKSYDKQLDKNKKASKSPEYKNGEAGVKKSRSQPKLLPAKNELKKKLANKKLRASKSATSI